MEKHPAAKEVAVAAGVNVNSVGSKSKVKVERDQGKSANGGIEHGDAGEYHDDDNEDVKSRQIVTSQGCSRVFIVKGTFKYIYPPCL